MGTKWGLSYVSYVIHTIHWILSPLPFFISLFQLRLVLFFVYFFLLFSLFLALPFQDCKGPITITKRRLSCAVYYSHFFCLVLSSSRSYPLLALVSHPARRVCGLRLFAACMFKQWHEALLLQLIFSVLVPYSLEPSFLVTFTVLCGIPMCWGVITWWLLGLRTQRRCWWPSADLRLSPKISFRHSFT